MPLLWSILLFVAFAPASTASPLPAQEKKARSELFVRADGAELRAAIQVRMQPGWHLYHDQLGPPDAVGIPTKVVFSGADAAWSPVRFPEPVRLEQEYGNDGKPTWIWAHEGTFALYARGKLAPGADPSELEVKISGLACDEQGCVPYSEEVANAGAGPDELFRAFPSDLTAGGSGSAAPPHTQGPEGDPSGPVPSGDGASLEKEGRGGLLGFLALAVFWGLFTLLMPCTYPMIPITISFFTKQADQRPAKQLSLSLVYGLGIVLIFILIGVIFGAAIVRFATHPVTNLVIGAAFLLFALALFGAIDLKPPRFLMNAAGQASQTGGYLGVFFMGATLVVTSFTCTAPFVGSLLSVGATEGNLSRVVLGMGVFGLTMAVPFVLLSLVPGRVRAMPRSGEWMHVLKVFLGFVEVAAALKFLSNADLVWQWGILSRELFLVLWAGIFLVAALFLLGMVKLAGETGGVGPLRLVFGTLALLFSLYCGYGSLGREMDSVMTAIIPNYSHATVGAVALGAAGSRERIAHAIVKDDHPEALERARAEGKLVLVNFTGFT